MSNHRQHYYTTPRHRWGRVALYALAFVAALGVAGYIDHDDEKRQAETYCDFVHKGMWPDYDEVFTQMCNPDGTVKEWVGQAK